jgi:hypothetical protein
MPISGYKAGRTSHTPFAYHKREYSIWSSKFCSTVSVFPHPSSPKSPTPNKLPAVGPTCHTFIPTQPTPAAPPPILSLLSLHLAPSAQPPPTLRLSPTGERRWRTDPDHRAAALPLLPRWTPFSRNSSTAGSAAETGSSLPCTRFGARGRGCGRGGRSTGGHGGRISAQGRWRLAHVQGSPAPLLPPPHPWPAARGHGRAQRDGQARGRRPGSARARPSSVFSGLHLGLAAGHPPPSPVPLSLPSAAGLVMARSTNGRTRGGAEGSA